MAAAPELHSPPTPPTLTPPPPPSPTPPTEVKKPPQEKPQVEEKAAASLPRSPARLASLYVGDLHPDVSDTDLLTAFRPMGGLASVRICRDALSGKSLCYGYVNFFSHAHASKAVACLNHTDLKGKPIRIMPSQRDPIQRETGIANLYVKNLDHSISSARLESIFCKYGTILSCKVVEVKGKGKGYGYVQFDSEDSAMAALSALHDTMIEGKKLYVSKFVKKGERTASYEEPQYTNLYVKNLTEDITVDNLQEMFSDYGKISNVVIMRNREGKSRGFGFVIFESPDAAKKAVDALNGKIIGSKALFVGRAQKRTEREEQLSSIDLQNGSCNLYVRNLGSSVDAQKLEQLFSKFGKITSVKVMCNIKGLSKGFGFVCFSTPEDAKKALLALNGTIFEGKSLYVAVAQRKEDHSKLRESQMNFQPQCLPPSSWNFISNQYSSTPHNTPFFPIPHSMASQSVPYHYFGANIGLHNNFSAENYQHAPYVPSKQKPTQWGSFKDWTCGNQTMAYSSSSMQTQGQIVKSGELKPGFRRRGDKRCAPLENTFFGSISPRHRAFMAGASHVVSNRNLENILYPLVENIKPEDATKITEMLLQMNESDIKRLLKSPTFLTSQVNKADRVLREANHRAIVDDCSTLSKSACCRNY